MKKEIRICNCHDKEVPLIWTFAFDGAEYWCPYCGYTCGMFGAGKVVKLTPELKQSQKEWIKKTKPFLTAVSTLNCSAMKIKGVLVMRKDFPAKMVEKYRKIRNEFEYEG